MSRPHRGPFEAWLRGGQTVGHTFDMTVEVIGRLALIAVLLALALAIAVNSHASSREQTAGWITAEATILANIGKPLPQEVTATDPAGNTHPVDVHKVWQDPVIAIPAKAYWNCALAGLVGWLGACWIMGVVANYIFTLKGRDKIKARQIRGQEVARLSELRKEIEDFNLIEAKRRARNAFIAPELAGIPYPFETELEHTLVVGAPGAGKSQAIHQLVESIRERGHRAIIFDPELDFIRHHYDPGIDTILNPFDARSPGWSPFFDATDTPDWVKLGHAIFKDPKSGDPYWVNVARSLFAWTGYRLRETNPNVGLTEALALLFGPPSNLKRFLEGTPAALHLNGLEGGGARVASLISVLAEGVEPLIYLHGAKGRFSIREWVNRPVSGDRADGGFLFFSAPESHMDALRPLLGFWSELAVSALLSRHDTSRTTTWFILDEFHSAGKIEKLADGPQRLRKYGGAVVLGFQQVSQLQDLYGPDKAKTIIGQCQTKLILRAGDFDTATLMSEQLGRRVMRRVEENTSYGANSIRDGVGLTPKEELEPVVLPEDVQNFPKFQGMIRVSNARASKPFPIAPIKIAFVDRPEIASGFVPADSDPVRDYIAQHLRGTGAQDGTGKGPGSGPTAGGAPSPGPAPKPAPGGAGLAAANAPDQQHGPIGAPSQIVFDQVPVEAPEQVPAHAVATPEPAKGMEEPSTRLRGLIGRMGSGSSKPREAVVQIGQPPAATVSVAPAASGADLSGQTATGGGPEPEMKASETTGGGDDVEPGALKDMRPRRTDLPTDEAERIRRREEEDEAYRNMRAADLRREPDDGRVRVSVMQREGEMLQEEQTQGEYLGSLETATQSELLYAEHHRHQILETVAEVGLSGVVGANVRLVGPGLPDPDAAVGAEEPALTGSGDHRASPEESDREAEGDADDFAPAGEPLSDEALARDAGDQLPGGPVEETPASDPVIWALDPHRHHRHRHPPAELDGEYEPQPDPTRERDREPELEMDP